VTLLQIYALTAIVLTLKMSAVSVVQGRARVAAGIFVNPEDAKTFQASHAPEDAPDVRRASRAWLNDLENIPIFLILCGIYVAANLSTTAFAIYCLVFMLARIAHTFFYLNAIQPWRTISFTLGAVAALALMIHLFIGAVL
jgi:uncharacterized membrane protein YecN with MAPEG domain